MVQMPAGRITALHAQAHDSQRVNVFIDGEFAIGVSLTTIAQEKLFVGRELTAEDYTRLERAEQADRAVQAALRFIEARPRSSAEVRERLLQKELPPDIVEQALARLGQLGLVDDTAFARYWVENRQTFRPRGSNALRDELRRKGVDRNVISTVLSDEELVGDASEQAMELARASLHKYASADRASFSRRLGGYLQRRGFQFDVVRPIIEQLWAELQREDDTTDDEG